MILDCSRDFLHRSALSIFSTLKIFEMAYASGGFDSREKCLETMPIGRKEGATSKVIKSVLMLD